MKIFNIRPVVKRDSELPIERNKNPEPSPGDLAEISAMVTGQPQLKSNMSRAISPHMHTEKLILEESPVVVPSTPNLPRLQPPNPRPLPKPKELE